MYTIQSARLGFLPMDKELLEAALLGESELANYLGLNVIEGVIEPIHKERVFPTRLKKLAKNPSYSKWYGYIIELKSNTVIGMMGFKTPPNEKSLIEIGYGIHLNFRGNGYATEMTQALKEWAFQQPLVKGIKANISSDNYASLKIAEKLGMIANNQNKDCLNYIVFK